MTVQQEQRMVATILFTLALLVSVVTLTELFRFAEAKIRNDSSVAADTRRIADSASAYLAPKVNFVGARVSTGPCR